MIALPPPHRPTPKHIVTLVIYVAITKLDRVNA
jgi:hypothetical protein